jgi:hypothetical protein
MGLDVDGTRIVGFRAVSLWSLGQFQRALGLGSAPLAYTPYLRANSDRRTGIDNSLIVNDCACSSRRCAAGEHPASSRGGHTQPGIACGDRIAACRRRCAGTACAEHVRRNAFARRADDLRARCSPGRAGLSRRQYDQSRGRRARPAGGLAGAQRSHAGDIFCIEEQRQPSNSCRRCRTDGGTAAITTDAQDRATAAAPPVAHGATTFRTAGWASENRRTSVELVFRVRPGVVALDQTGCLGGSP